MLYYYQPKRWVIHKERRTPHEKVSLHHYCNNGYVHVDLPDVHADLVYAHVFLRPSIRYVLHLRSKLVCRLNFAE